MEKTKAFLSWFWSTSAVVGAPVLIVLLIVGMQRCFFTLTCETAGVGCAYSIRSDAMIKFVSKTLEENPDSDLELKPRKK